ncbi:MAG: PE PGRS family protein [Parcubacteria group bacterium Gr01-1014_48]|nr:MAG: PE PGRS family protein [Parcubacteria group bacterium Greene0416_14]TSC73909.1 MAG: PE PGRS family protein [Parcubacteria group bacterium Gr01-1014_48]TSD00310.1 MAG: PE PGRS family protein [Parcubacteria group bacterium Greene1014_15]TSD07921.1 MAG: PE PGRS family protein [Parcubacteria group bacterium Greene0714_4]
MQFEARARLATKLYLLIQRGSKRAKQRKNAPNAYIRVKNMTVKKVTAAALAVVLAAAALPVFADGDVLVENNNSALVTNVVTSSANTGWNWAGGSYGGRGGRGGDIANDGGVQNVDDSSTGDGGNGGNAGVGGEVDTGDALANATLTNTVNDNDTEVDLCGCDPEHPTGEHEGHHVTVRNTNTASVDNLVAADADTGDNEAEGSHGGEGDRGGDIYNGSSSEGVQNVDGSSTGNGGKGGTGDAGGLVTTGHSTSNASATSVTNRNVTRIKH